MVERTLRPQRPQFTEAGFDGYCRLGKSYRVDGTTYSGRWPSHGGPARPSGVTERIGRFLSTWEGSVLSAVPS
jgi:hypothetical protein